ncbi:thiol:disulfide interchange protein DsbA [Dyella sp. SG562]|jgi:thiol:disulfide interchange protein DsbA|uniref:thiol:disulfide interchange protein DsbA/DsbL n=1 Tax=Dyella TaxID=231454 RepID=UPI001422AF81|nr:MULTISPECIES: thiol:disulfide interchange protein DsbA/DsbL [unclassified Dyella]MBT2117430.1 thiol:disulfide interchange protein DsbA/DsbL [Dyella sp. LX-1]MBT2138494.1 thiol:disulfide interchange protein DsbA/DsbL [Dyella sp. LX-66]NII72774.1 thiol:disulfide interchange protein DsbA [Dyella sp. SG562]NKJ21694.1 thiol:disulfide interchange protein DsbA [Dyella sp. SG609]
MFKRIARLRVAALLAGLVLTSACTASNSNAAAPYTEGKEYVALAAPAQRYSADGKVEVVEVFSYGCVHCAHFAPKAEELRKQLPPGVKFKLLPAAFSDAWLPYARAYYAAEKLGVADKTHLDLFAKKFDQHYPISTLDELADYYATQGVDRAKFLAIATSPEVTQQIKKDLELIQKWGVDGTPTIVVDGKYRSNEVKTLDQLSALAQWLAQRELSGAK